MTLDSSHATTQRGTGSLDEQKAWEQYFSYLIKSLSSNDASTRQQSAHILGEHREPRAIEALSALLLDDPDMGVRQQAAWALGQIGDPHAVEVLIHALHVPDLQVRQIAGKALAQLGDPRAVEPLIEALMDSHSDVRSQAAFALNKIGAPAVEPLIAALRHPNPAVRWSVARILGSIGDARALPELDRAAREDNTPVPLSSLPDTVKSTQPLANVAQAAGKAAEKIRQGKSTGVLKPPPR
jgi:HEAT repeat protein